MPGPLKLCDILDALWYSVIWWLHTVSLMISKNLKSSNLEQKDTAYNTLQHETVEMSREEEDEGSQHPLIASLL